MNISGPLSLLLLHQNFWAALALYKRRNDFADVAWGLGFVVLALTSFFQTSQCTLAQALVWGLVTLWGLRLSWYLHSRVNLSQEDSRYQAMRQGWPKNRQALNSYLRVFVLQGILLLLVASPIFAAQNISADSPWTLPLAGLALFAILFESASDIQLQKFRLIKKPGQIMQTGLWRYSRHPNYFAEILFWLSVASISAAQGIYWAYAGPVILSFLLIKVSGIALTEKRYAKNPEFQTYKERTSALIPWFPSGKK
jgi:steroid 5-alpha reductase family enzyme